MGMVKEQSLDMALINENEGGNSEVSPELVDDRTHSPKSNSIQNSEVSKC